MANPTWFNKEQYLTSKLQQLRASGDNSYADIVAVDLAIERSGKTAFSHFEAYGAEERTSPNTYFNAAEYLQAKANQMNGLLGNTKVWTADSIALAIKDAGLSIWSHFQTYGWKEGVNPSNSFDVSSYFDTKLAQLQKAEPAKGWTLQQVKDAFAAAGTDPISHFTANGAIEALAVTAVPEAERVTPDSTGVKTFTLTTGADTIVGTAGNDVINALSINATGADATTLTAFDSIDGGAGNDTLNIFTKTGFNDGAFPANVTVKNVETINYNNTDAGVAVDASKFVGATLINQIGFAAGVTNLAATTTAGFKGVTAAAGGTPLDVAAAAAATSASLKLDGVKGLAVTNVVSAAVSGAAVNSVTVAGTLAQTTVNATAASLALGVTGSTTATSFALNTAVDTALTLTGMAAVTSVDAAASVGGVTFDGTTQVQTINTGSGKDTVTTAFATTAAKGVTISSGAGNDTVNVNTTGAGLTSVDAGAGDDMINVAKAAGNKLNILGGEGNDTVVLTGTLATTDNIDGGAGVDTISLAGSATRTDDDFIVLNSLLKNFETLKFSTAEGAALTAFNAGKLSANYTTLDFAAASFVDNVGTQALVANGAFTAEAAGYKSAAENTPANTIVYAGALNITDVKLGATADAINAHAATVNLTVKGGSANAVTANAAVLTGEAQAATVTLSAGTDTKGTTATTDDVYVASTVTITNAAGAEGLKDLASLTLTGNGTAVVTNVDATKLVTVDASGLNSVDITGKAVAGLTYTSDNKAVETIKLGGGVDVINLNASTYGAVNAKTFDTVEGLNLVKDGAVLAATSDDINVKAGAVALTGFQKFTTTQTDLDLALKDAAIYKVGAVDADNVVFQLGGNTYVYSDQATTGVVDSADVLVKLVGTIDLDNLILALG